MSRSYRRTEIMAYKKNQANFTKPYQNQ